ncbi:YtzC family protein [Calidifontibacillus oryziterrae]|uniref:YtzC family protein n=1 Tax=Calidifontibacillus oryziterrae TaxID=1191699 RepID=UPI0002E1F0A8|nr:YtzC family protein [Calidifontibacillus oryziterrae]
MATRVSVDQFIHRAEEVCKYALEQLETANKQESYNTTEYTDAQRLLNETYNDLQQLMLSSDKQQKERLYRMQLKIDRIQNDLILDQNNLIM